MEFKSRVESLVKDEWGVDGNITSFSEVLNVKGRVCWMGKWRTCEAFGLKTKQFSTIIVEFQEKYG